MNDIFKSAEYARKLVKETVVLSVAAQEAREMITHLQAIRKLISDPKTWTVNTRGKTKHGHTCAARDPAARAWCILGAGEKVRADLDDNKMFRGVDMLTAKALQFGDPWEAANWNNEAKHSEVIGRIDVCIAQWEKVK
jgi:hypothetical protein